MVKPYFRSRLILSWVMGFSSIAVFMEGAASFLHLAARTTVESISSAIPWAIFAIISAVAGAIRMRSDSFATDICLTSNSNSRSKVSTMHLEPVSVSKVSGVINFVAFSVMITCTLAPALWSALATFAIL